MWSSKFFYSIFLAIALVFGDKVHAQSMGNPNTPVFTKTFQTPKEGNFRVVQGIARFAHEEKFYWFISQDPDALSSDASGGVVFSILETDGTLLRSFHLSDGIHPSSIIMDKQKDGSFKIYSETHSKKGFTLFTLSADLKQMKSIKKVEPSRSASAVFSMSKALNLVARGVTKNGLYCVELFKLKDYLSGTEVSHSDFQNFCLHKNHLSGPLQGLAIDADNTTLFAISGDLSFDKNTYIYRYKLSNGKVVDSFLPEAQSPTIKKLYDTLVAQPAKYKTFEPEGLFYRNNRLYYTINTGKNGNRIPILVRIDLPK